MPFTDSILFNGKSIRDFLTEIIEVKGRGKPKVRKRSSLIIGRHGDFVFGQTFAPRIIRIAGYLEGASHATLMLNIDNIKNLFRMDDQILATGEESISDGVEYGKLEFGDESDRYYRAIYSGVYILTEISQRWFSNDLKRIEIELRCDDPFAYAVSLSEATMSGSADEFKVFDLGTANNEVIVELNGAVTNPVIVEGDKVGVAHFDYDDDLTDVEVNTVSGNFAAAFGFRTRKTLTSQQSKAIQIVSKDNLYYDRGAVVNNQNYVNFNPYQGTLVLWVKPYFDGDDGLNHYIFAETGNSSNKMILFKDDNNFLIMSVRFGSVTRNASIAVTSANFVAGTWYMVVGRWDINNNIDSSSNTVQIDLNTAEAGNTGALSTPTVVDETLSIGQDDGLDAGLLFDGLIYYEILERALTDSEITDKFNSGAGVEPFVTPDTKLLSAGELSGGDPVSIQYPWVDNKFTTGNQEVDPAAEWVDAGTDGTGANTEVSTVTNIVKYDLQSAVIEWQGAATGEYVYLATVALVDNQDYFYRLWVYANALNASDELHLDIVGNSTVLTRRLDTGTDDMGVSYATGKWLYFEGTFEADGAVAHQFRFRKVNANGSADINIDQLDCQVNLIDNGGFEGTYVAGLAPDWILNGTPTVAEENVIVHTEGAAQKITADASNEGIRQTSFILLANTWYSYFVWARGAVGGEDLRIVAETFDGIVGVNDKVFTLTTTYTKYIITFKIASDTSGVIRLVTNNPDTIYVDDAGIIELDTVVANAASQSTPEIDSYSEEKFGQGLRIDGADTLSWSIKSNKNEGSIEVWLKPQFDADWADDTDDVYIFSVQFSTGERLRLFYDWTDDKWTFMKTIGGSGKAAESLTQTFTKNQRLHIIGTYGANGVNIYVGSIIGTPHSDTTALSNNPTVLRMGEFNLGIFPDSIVDEIIVYSRELSQQEVTAQFNKFRATKNDNAKIAMTKVLAANDKLRIDTERELIEFVDSSGATFTNAIASMDSGSVFFKMNANKSVIFNKNLLTNSSVVSKIKLNYLKRFL